jgi:hypothetical protein
MKNMESMEQKKRRSYVATFRDLELKIWESGDRHPWSVTNSKTGEEIAHGETIDLEDAMVGAAQAAQADWGTVRWRSDEPEDSSV